MGKKASILPVAIMAIAIAAIGAVVAFALRTPAPIRATLATPASDPIAPPQADHGSAEIALHLSEPAPGTEPPEVQLVLDAGLSIKGKVSCEDGVPAAGASLTLRLRTAAGDHEHYSMSKTDQDGRFEFKGLQEGAGVLEIDHPDCVGRELECAAGNEELDIVLERAARIRGTLTDDSGKTLTEVSVIVQPRNDDVFNSSDSDRMRRVRSPELSADGRFEVTGVPLIECRIYAQNYRGTKSQEIELDLRETKLIEGVRLVLPRGLSISGRVTDQQGAPLPGASVWLGRIDESRTGCQDFDCADYIGDYPVGADGRFELTDLEPAARYWLMAHREDCVVAPDDGNRVIALAGATDLELTLQSGGTLRGQVVDPDGNPAAGANVTLTCIDGAAAQVSRSLVGSRTSATNQDGAFALTGTSAGTWELKCNADGFAAPPPLVHKLMDKEERSDLELRLKALPQGTLSGFVQDQHGNPVADVDVSFRFDDELDEGAAASKQSDYLDFVGITLQDGTIRIKGVPEGEYVVQASIEGYSLRKSDEAALRLRSGEHLELMMIRLAIVRGRVVDSVGNPVRRFQVQSLFDPRSLEGGFSTWRSRRPPPQGEHDGRFELRFREPPVDLIGVRVEPGAGFMPTERKFQMSDPEADIDVGEIVVVKGLRLSGRVVNSKGEPVENVDLDLGPAQHAEEGAPDDAAVRISESTKSDRHGAFRFEGFPAGDHTLRARHSDYLDVESSCVLVGEDSTIEVTLESGASLRGIVIGFDGMPLVGAHLRAGGNNAVTGADGRYAIRGLEAGELGVSLSVWDGTRYLYWLSAHSLGKSGDGVHDFDLSKGWCRVHGTVSGLESDSQSRGMPQIKLTWPQYRNPSVSVDCQLGEDGRFEFLPVPPGSYMLLIAELHEVEVIVPATADHELRIELATSRIAGVISRRDGKRFEHARLRLMRMIEGEYAGERDLNVDSRGRFLGTNIEPGTYEVSATIFDYGYKTFDLEIAPGQDLRDLAIVISGGGAIRIRVVDGEGQPVPDACSYILDSNDELPYGRGEPQELAPAEWELGGLPPGRFTIIAGTPELGAARQEGVELAEAGEAAITLILPCSGARLLARVTRDGEPHAGVFMRMLTPEQKYVDAPCTGSSNTLSDGTVLFDRLPPGNYIVRIASDAAEPGYIDHPVTITANEGTVEVHFEH